MTLYDYMHRLKITELEMARRIGHCSISAVHKWRFGDRIPPVNTIDRIIAATGGEVRYEDFLVAPITRKERRALAP